MGREKIKRALLIAGETVEKVLRLVLAKVHDATKTDLPDTPSSDDLGLAEAIGSVLTTIETNGGATASTIAYALFRFVLDPWYDAGKDITIRIRAVTSALGEVADTVDVEVKRVLETGGVGADLNGTFPADIAVAVADYDFVVDGATLEPGDEVQLRLCVTRDDTGGTESGTITVPKVSVLHSAPDIDAIG